MNLFNWKKKEIISERKVFAVQDGQVRPIDDVSDPVFVQKILGDGVVIQPTGGTVVSPVNGRIIFIAETHHAYSIRTTNGLELLIHIGIDTVELKGEGFNNHVTLNQKVDVGTVLCEIDLDLLKDKGYQSDIVIIVTNQADLKTPIRFNTGMLAESMKTCIMEY